MVTPAGKEMLKNTINTVKLHNRILEENEMWRHWYMEKGLTMMVSDDLIRKEKTFSAVVERARRRSKKKRKHKEKHKRNKHESRESRHSSKNGLAKVANSSLDRWDHSGFEELYPETKSAVKNDSTEVKRCPKDGTKKCKLNSHNTSPSTDSESSDSKEIWEEFKLFKKRKHKDSGCVVSKFQKKDDSDSDQGNCKKHKGSEGTSKKKKCESKHCHHKHRRKEMKHKHS